MSSARFEDGKVADGIAQTADMTASVDLGMYMGLPHEKLRECLVKRRVDEMKIFCRNSSLKVPACKKQELVEIIFNYGIWDSSNLPVLRWQTPLFPVWHVLPVQVNLPKLNRASSVREGH